MKRRVCLVLLIIVLFVVVEMDAETVKVISGATACNIRNKPGVTGTRVIGQVYVSDVSYEVLSTKEFWWKIIVLNVGNNKTMTGWMWTEVFKKDKSKWIVSGKGATLRKEPKKGDNVVDYIFPGSIVLKRLKVSCIWYKVKYKGLVGWIDSSFTK